MDFKHTNLPIETTFPKLVRDNIPEIIERQEGYKPETRRMNNEEFQAFLLKKAHEELEELANASNEQNAQEELADIFEIIDCILSLKGWKRETIENIQTEKRHKNGGFNNRILLLKRGNH